ncbi:hypothetical protein [Xenorhabdus beddingii]|uniref:hypothetical protein n=1 Tax=Xenorhabdus beddingii TaxID=40578 RepID=UPI00111C019A|nr:hypothetical protein [Xenorhabdus beddingii]
MYHYYENLFMHIENGILKISANNNLGDIKTAREVVLNGVNLILPRVLTQNAYWSYGKMELLPLMAKKWIQYGAGSTLPTPF